MRPSKKSEQQIKNEVLQALKQDPGVDEAEIGVIVHDRTVTLVGTTTSYAKKLAGEAAAHRIAGVLDVADQVEVNVPGGLVPTDTEIAHAVRHLRGVRGVINKLGIGGPRVDSSIVTTRRTS